MKKLELLVDYCQRCGNEIGSFECCQSSLNKAYREDTSLWDKLKSDPSKIIEGKPAKGSDDIVIE